MLSSFYALKQAFTNMNLSDSMSESGSIASHLLAHTLTIR